MITRLTLALAAAILVVPVYADADPGTGANMAGQAIADVLRESTGADMAFVAAGLLRPDAKGDQLSGYVMFPTDKVVTVRLTGKQVRAALERSLDLYPQANPSFLQVSGIEIKFDSTRPAGSRITSLSLGDTRSYTVAMPSNLARGGLGYFQIWDSEAIQGSPAGTLEELLKGRTMTQTAPRWVAGS